MKTDIQQYQKVCTDAGVQFIEADGQFVFFQDKITKEQLKVEKAKFNNPRVQAIVTTARRKYPKDIEMLSDCTDALRFIFKKYYTVPERVNGDAAFAATLVVQQFINEQKNNSLPLQGGDTEGVKNNEKIAA